MAQFTTHPVLLKSLLGDVETGKIRLPDFQRGWVWDDYRIRSLIASISRGFPVGAVMTLQAGGEINFKTRLVEGVDGEPTSEIGQFLLDGQQRLTSLYQALKSPNTTDTRDSRGKRIGRWYYVDMLKAMAEDIDREEVIVSVPEDKRVTRDFGREVSLDVSTPEFEYANHMMPTQRLMDPTSWLLAYVQHWQGRDEDHPIKSAVTLWGEFEPILDTFKEYSIPVISLDKETPKEAVCTVFEKVNTGGVTLTVFELVTASFAASDFSLRDDWFGGKEQRGRRQRLHEAFGVLRGIEGVQFLQAVALLATQKRRREKVREQPDAPPNQIPRIGCQKRDILNLTLADYKEWAGKVEDGFMEAAKFIHGQFVFKEGDVPYNTQLIPLAVLFAELDRELIPAKAKERLEHWYWSGIFGEAYGGSVETQYALDLDEVAKYVRGGPLPRLIVESTFNPERLISLRTRNSAAYKGLYALQMKAGASDWATDNLLVLDVHHEKGIDIHHIFPVAWCESNGVHSSLYNSIVNKTPIDAHTNRMIGGAAPSRYLPRLERDIAPDKLRSVLRHHWVNPDLLRQDDFAGCFVERGERMLTLIGTAMGKEILGGAEALRNALAQAGLLPPDDEPTDADGHAKLDEFDDGEPEYEDDIGSAAYEPDDDEA